MCVGGVPAEGPAAREIRERVHPEDRNYRDLK